MADPPLITPIEDLIVPGTEWEDPARRSNSCHILGGRGHR